MGLKQISNSPKSRITLGFIGLVMGSFLLSGALCASVLLLPALAKNTFEGELKEQASSWSIRDLKVGEEPNPLPELPASQLSYVSKSMTASPADAKLTNHPVGFPAVVLAKQKPDTLINTAVVYNKDQPNDSGPDYTFKFYAGSLTDYDSGASYEATADQFFALNSLGLKELAFESKPNPTGGRVLSVKLKTYFSMDEANRSSTVTLWKNIIARLQATGALNGDSTVDLTLEDAQLVKVKALLTEDSSVTAQNFPETVWSTVAGYTYSNAFSFLKPLNTELKLERTVENSTLKITVAEELRKAEKLDGRILKLAVDSEEKVDAHPRYTTYFVTESDQTPLLTFNSSSKEW